VSSKILSLVRSFKISDLDLLSVLPKSYSSPGGLGWVGLGFGYPRVLRDSGIDRSKRTTRLEQNPQSSTQDEKKSPLLPIPVAFYFSMASSSSSSRSIHRPFSPLLSIEPSSDGFLDSDIQSSVRKWSLPLASECCGATYMYTKMDRSL
jgi:hypothetical protein